MKNRNPISNAVVFYLLIILAGFAAGTFPQVWRARPQYDSPVLLTLPCVFGAQAFFFMLIYPSVWMERVDREKQRGAAGFIFEVGLMVSLAIPFYIAGWWFSDAGLLTFLKLAAVLAAVIIWSFLGCSLIRKNTKYRTPVMAMNLLLTLGIPAGVYIVAEFF